MAYGNLSVDYITYTSNEIDVTTTISSVFNGEFSAITVTGSSVPSNGVYLPSANTLGISTSGVGHLFVDSNGRLGIGTGSPALHLDVIADYNGTEGARIRNESTSGLAQAKLQIDSAGRSVNYSVSYTLQSATEQGTNITSKTSKFDTHIWTNGAGSESLRINSSGYLGVGIGLPVTKLDLAGAYSSNVSPVSSLDISCSSGNYFTKTIASDSTFTVSNIPSGRAYSFTLEVTHTSGAITWFSGVEWPSATAPTLTTGTTHLFMFVTDDGGTRWRGAALVDYTN